MTRWVPVAVAFLATATCAPSLGPGDSLVTSTRILAVRAAPAEATPGTKVTFTALVASPGGTVPAADIDWSFCSAPKPITEDNVVASACLTASALVPAGAGPATTAVLPTDGCSLFGADTPSTGLRPRDPDVTGGYYQPLRVSLAGAEDAFALARIHCHLAQADAATASAFAAAYELNRNPKLLPLEATADGAPVALGAIPSGRRITLAASWTVDSAEAFALFDAPSGTVLRRRESMRVAWYASDGVFDTESTGRTASDPATSTDNGWTAPSTAGTVRVWIVLRDVRGGVDFAEYGLVVVK